MPSRYTFLLGFRHMHGQRRPRPVSHKHHSCLTPETNELSTLAISVPPLNMELLGSGLYSR